MGWTMQDKNKDCPCCSGEGKHDWVYGEDGVTFKCSACDGEGDFPVCENCGGDGADHGCPDCDDTGCDGYEGECPDLDERRDALVIKATRGRRSP